MKAFQTCSQDSRISLWKVAFVFLTAVVVGAIGVGIEFYFQQQAEHAQLELRMACLSSGHKVFRDLRGVWYCDGEMAKAGN
jgi:anti-sigma-K factor RskA